MPSASWTSSASVVLMVVLSPLMALLAVLVRLDSSGPVLFRQERVGLHGRTFTMVKFRSMCCDAEQRLAELRVRNEIQGHAFKLERDPRVTRMGRFLRRTSLDELPQLWNVLRRRDEPRRASSAAGERGRRLRRLAPPAAVDEAGHDGPVADRRPSRSPEFDHWVEKDLEYIDNWSLWLDVKIMARTMPAMLTGR